MAASAQAPNFAAAVIASNNTIKNQTRSKQTNKQTNKQPNKQTNGSLSTGPNLGFSLYRLHTATIKQHTKKN
jgi:hypothetical protein